MQVARSDIDEQRIGVDVAGAGPAAAYDSGLQPTTETFGSGMFNGLEVQRQYESSQEDVPGRFKGLAVDSSYSYQASYFYDATGRLSRVTGPGLSSAGTNPGANYSYLSDSDLLEQTDFVDNSAVKVRVHRQFEATRDLIDYVENIWRPGGHDQTTISKYDYTNDSRGRRTQVQYTGSAFTNPPLTQTLTYNDRNELTGSTRSDNSGLARGYTYDPIGNRTQSTEGTTPSVKTSTYNPSPIDNPLNQYDRVETSGGGVSPTAQGYRFDDDGDMLEAYVAADMDCNGVINASDNTAFLLYLNDPVQYGLQHPGCNPLHGDMDGDGDTDWDDYDLFVDWLTGHSGAGGTRQVYAWDAENRLIAVGPPVEGPPAAGAKRATYAYDYMGRRIEKKVYTWQSMQWVLTDHRRFVYGGTGTGGWLMLMELNGLNNNAVLRQYTWGLDLGGQNGGQTSGLSGLEAAGGIRGLLAVEQPQGGGSSLNYVYFYDANGNVGQVIDPDAGNASASIKVKYEYDPYGTRSNLPQPGEFDQAFRFSTKYFDAESGLYYFGYRYYHPKLGRWVSRDPRAERADPLLYGYVHNVPTARLDPVGLQATQPSSAPTSQECCEFCGPDMTEFVRKLTRSAIAWRSKQPKDISGAQARQWLWDNGTNLDWWSVGAGDYRIPNDICPTAGKCEHTYWICDTCVHDHWIANFMFGFIGRLLGLSETTLTFGGADVQGPGPGDPAGPPYHYVDPPCDVAGYKLGFGVFDATRDDFSAIYTDQAFCSLMKGKLRDAFDLANTTDVGFQPEGAQLSKYWRYPTPHAHSNNYKDCAKCPWSLPKEKLVWPGGKFGGGFPPINP